MFNSRFTWFQLVLILFYCAFSYSGIWTEIPSFLHSLPAVCGLCLHIIAGWVVSSKYSCPPDLQNMILFGNSCFAVVMKLSWCHIALGWALNPMIGDLLKSEEGIETHREEGHGKTESENAVNLSRAKDHHKAPEPGEDKGRFSPRAFRKCVALSTLDFTLLPPELWKNTFLLFYATGFVVIWCGSSENSQTHVFIMYLCVCL